MPAKKKTPKPRDSAKTTLKDPQTLQLRITLLDVQPTVWRRFRISNHRTLADLRLAVQIVMGWEDSHLDEFELGGKRYSVARGGIPAMGIDFGDEPENDAQAAVLSEVLPKAGTRFFYTYDFGDTWEHELLVEKVLPVDPAVAEPLCLEGVGACPPEDCGGPWGYADLIEALTDPEHEAHEEMKEWVGENFDPKVFSVEAVNRELRNHFRPARRRK